MTPEKEKALTEHIQAIAEILYEETSPEQLTDLESIEATVRERVTEYVNTSTPLGVDPERSRRVNPPIGFFGSPGVMVINFTNVSP